MKIVVDAPIDPQALPAVERMADVVAGRDLSLLEGADVLVCHKPPPEAFQSPTLRWIQITSTGYEQLIGLPFAERGIRATNARGTCDPQIAEWNLCMMVNLVRHVPQMIRNQAEARWDKSPFQGEIRGRTVGFWGYGGLARETARLARQMGMTVHVLVRSGLRPRGENYAPAGTGDPEAALPHRVFTAGQEIDFLSGLDFLVLALPLTHASTGLVGERQLRALPKTAYLLNPSRGAIVEEKSLTRALEEGWIAGAALDTHHPSPLPPEHPLWRNPRAIITPHMAGGGPTPAVVGRLWDLFQQNVRRFKSGRPLLNELTPSELAGN